MSKAEILVLGSYICTQRLKVKGHLYYRMVQKIFPHTMVFPVTGVFTSWYHTLRKSRASVAGHWQHVTVVPALKRWVDF